MATPVASSAPAASSTTADTGKAVAPSAAPAASPGNELTAKMLQALKGEKGDLVFSATSVRGALGLAALGAKGATLDELSKALTLDPDPAKNGAAAKAEHDAWTSAAGKAELNVANRVWAQKSYAIEKSFSDAAQASYGAAPVLVDFAGAADPSRKKINGWVSDTTKGRIKDLLPPGSVTPLTRVVLTNAVYFKGTWTEPFVKAQTKDEPFQAPAGAKNVATMHRTGHMSYGESDEAQVVSLPYKDSDLVMVVVLPKQADHMDAMIAGLTGAKVDALGKGLSSQRVVLSFPKFTFAWGRSVKPELQALGVATAFTDKADFTGIANGKEPLYVSDVFHKAFVLVDETGTEAAASTGVVMTTKAIMVEKERVMKVDHPFLFFIENAKTGDVLFAGRVVDPKP